MGLMSWMKGIVGKSSSLNTFFNINVSPISPFAPRPLTLEEALGMKKIQSTVFSCVGAISQAFQEARLSVWETTPSATGKPQLKEIPNHPALDPFTKNPWLDENDIDRYMIEHLELGGAIYLWKWMSGAGVEYVWPLPPSWVVPVPQQKELRNEMDPEYWVIEKYSVYPPGKSAFELRPDEVVYIREIDPNNLYGSMSPLITASSAIDSMKRGNDAHLQQLDTLKTPGLIIHTAEDMTDEQRADLQRILAEKLGTNARKNALILTGDKTKAEMLTPMAGFNWDSMRDFDEIRICQAFRVPPIVAGCWVGFKNSPWSNTEEAWRSFYQHKMMGRWKQIARGLTRGLLLKDNESSARRKLEFRYDVAEIKYLQDDADARVDRSIKLFHGGLIKRNEALEISGQPPIPKGDPIGEERVIPMNLVVVGAAPEPALPAEEHLPFGQEEPPPEEPEEPIEAEVEVEKPVPANEEE
jgi:HK97 family phage portal protein